MCQQLIKSDINEDKILNRYKYINLKHITLLFIVAHIIQKKSIYIESVESRDFSFS